jgi:hypothetical protein
MYISQKLFNSIREGLLADALGTIIYM